LRVIVKFFATAREIAGVQDETLEIEDSAAVLQLLKLLVNEYGKRLEEYVFDPNTREPRPHLTFLLDGRTVSMLHGFDTTLTDGSTLAIVPPVSGG